jgi:LysR family glycine cleavage system transcriptional activator
LEAFLGLDLFERRVRKVSLNLAGERYLATVSQAFMQIQAATGALVGQVGGELKLAVAPTFLDRWLLPRFNDFTQRHPEIELDIHSSIGVIDFSQSDIDMAVYFGDGEWGGINCTLLRPSFLVPVCAPELLEQERIMVPADLLKLRLLQVKKRPEHWPSWFALSQTDYHPAHGIISFSNGMLTANVATKGLGVALTDPSLVSGEIERGELMVPIDLVMQLPKSFYLVSQKNRPLSYAMTAFQTWLTERMARDLTDHKGRQA